MSSRSQSKSLVIDANIARAAGESKRGPSTPCSNFLESVRESRHKVVFTPDVLREWDEHSSRFTSGWRGRMLRSNLILFLPDARDRALRSNIRKHAVDDGSRDAMLKDIRLLEAALKTDKNVASMDEKVRGHFGQCCRHIEEIREIMWVNPDTESKYCLEWLERGAPNEPEHQLGFPHRNR